jgi:hypothetical protein
MKRQADDHKSTVAQARFFRPSSAAEVSFKLAYVRVQGSA